MLHFSLWTQWWRLMKHTAWTHWSELIWTCMNWRLITSDFQSLLTGVVKQNRSKHKPQRPDSHCFAVNDTVVISQFTSSGEVAFGIVESASAALLQGLGKESFKIWVQQASRTSEIVTHWTSLDCRASMYCMPLLFDFRASKSPSMVGCSQRCREHIQTFGPISEPWCGTASEVLATRSCLVPGSLRSCSRESTNRFANANSKERSLYDYMKHMKLEGKLYEACFLRLLSGGESEEIP